MASWTSNKSVWNLPRGKFDLISAGSGPYLVVVGAVGAEIRLRTKHLVHHIQAAHGEGITENSRESRSAQWCSDRLGTLILPGEDSSVGGLRGAALRFYALGCLRALDGTQSTRTHIASADTALQPIRVPISDSALMSFNYRKDPTTNTNELLLTTTVSDLRSGFIWSC